MMAVPLYFMRINHYLNDLNTYFGYTMNMKSLGEIESQIKIKNTSDKSTITWHELSDASRSKETING